MRLWCKCAPGALLALAVSGHAHAASPAAGTLSVDTPQLSFSGGPFSADNPTDQTGSGATVVCQPDVAPCDEFLLSIRLPLDYRLRNPAALVRLQIAFVNDGSDYDVYVLDAQGAPVVIGYSEGPEEVEFAPPAGSSQYTVRVVPYVSGGTGYVAGIALSDGSGGATSGARDYPPEIPSDPKRPRVVVADLDTGINPYHSFFYRVPSSVTRQLLASLGVKPENVVKLTRTGNFAADLAADAAFWAGVKRGELYHFVGTNIIAISFAGLADIVLRPDAGKSAHGVATAAAVLTANPDAILMFVEQGSDIGSARSHAYVFNHPSVDIASTSYGSSVPIPNVGTTGVPMPEYRLFPYTYRGVVENGQLHFSSAGNGPGLAPLRAGSGPWWSIGISGINEAESNGKELNSGDLPDFVADYVQDLPYCMTCEDAITQRAGGTSFATPRAAGVASAVVLETRRRLGHSGGIRTRGSARVMAEGAGLQIRNWDVRRALEQAAYVPAPQEYEPLGEQRLDGSVSTLIGLPAPPVAPWLLFAWGNLTANPEKGVVDAALSQFGLGSSRRDKAVGFCEFQTAVIRLRHEYWGSIAPLLPEPPAALYGEKPAPTSDPGPFVYCDSAIPKQEVTSE